MALFYEAYCWECAMKYLRCLAALLLIFTAALAGCASDGDNPPKHASPGGDRGGSGGGY